MRGRKRKHDARRRQTTEAGRKFHGATPETLKRQAEILSIHGGMKDLRRLARNGTLAASENPIDTLLHKKIITQDMAREADQLRHLFIKLYGSPEAPIGAYGEFNGTGDPNAFPDREAAEYRLKTYQIVAWTDLFTLRHTLNISIFRRPADIRALKRGLKALVTQGPVPLDWETAKS